MIRLLTLLAALLLPGVAEAQYFPGYGPQNNFYVANGTTRSPSWYSPTNARTAIGVSTWAIPTGIVPLANGGTNAALTADNGAIPYSTGSAMAFLPSTGTPSQCLLSGNHAAPTWGACSTGAAVSSITASGGSLTISPNTGAVFAALNLSNANVWVGTQTFSNSGFKLLGSSTGATTFSSNNAGSSNFTLTIPAVNDQLAVLGTIQNWTAKQQYTNSNWAMFGSSTGTTTLTSANTTATNFTLTMPAVNDILAVLGTPQSYTAAQRGTPVNITIGAATFTPNFNTAQNFEIDLTSACPCTLANPSTTLVAGQSGTIEIHQDGTGSRTIGTWGTSYQSSGGTSTILLSTPGNSVDYVPYYVNNAGTAIILGGLIKAPSH